MSRRRFRTTPRPTTSRPARCRSSNGPTWSSAARGRPGVAAALAAARNGAHTRLIEVGGCLGGVWTAGLLSWILDAGNKAGLMREIVARLGPARRRGALPRLDRLRRRADETASGSDVRPGRRERPPAHARGRRGPGRRRAACRGRDRIEVRPRGVRRAGSSSTPPATAIWRPRPAAASTTAGKGPASCSR